ncbi:hypothetical protein C8D70_10477 [Chryseobacterium sp. CBTAP 102]|nr:hypothetical protein C8D70_10477 [Chryseobacterium sp. CBTAP 102]
MLNNQNILQDLHNVAFSYFLSIAIILPSVIPAILFRASAAENPKKDSPQICVPGGQHPDLFLSAFQFLFPEFFY